METRIDEIAPRIYRLSTYVPEIAPPAGFTFNQFLIDAEQPLLFHTGPRKMFPLVSAALRRIMPLERLRWVTFGHYEADECGAANEFLAAAPEAQVAHGLTACMVSLDDVLDRAPRPLADGEVIDLGGKKIRYIDTPHVPHGWEAGVIYEETTGTLFCGDLFEHLGDGPALTDDDIVGPALQSEDIFHATSIGPTTGPTIRKLAALAPKRLALMHGSSYTGNASAALRDLAGAFEGRLRDALAAQ